MPVARSNLRGFPSKHRLLFPSSRKVAEARPSWASLLSRTGRHLCRSRSISPGRDYRPPLLGFVGVCTPVPFHRLHPRRSPSRGVATASDPSRSLESRSDPVVSHDLVGFLRRSPGFSPGFSSPFEVTKDFRACCIPMPIIGFDAFLPPHPVEPAPVASSLLTASLAGHSDGWIPASKFVPPGGFPSPAAVTRLRVPCLLGLFAFSRSATFPKGSVSGSVLAVVSRGRRPSRPCSAGESVPSSTLFRRSLAYPPWALFPFEVAFRSILADGRASMMPCITVAPRLHTVAVASVPSIVGPRSLVGR